jgi:hypothetical protein
MITEYKVVCKAREHNLAEEVNKLLKDDWCLYGPCNIGVSGHGGVYLLQTLVKYEFSLHGTQTQQVGKRVCSEGAD